MSTWVRTGSGVIAPEHAVRITRRPTAVDLFCGCGGFTLGFLQAGFEVLAGLDNDPACLLTYLANLGSYPVDIQFADPTDKARANKEFEAEMRRMNKGKQPGELVRVPTSGTWWIKNNPDVPPVRHFFFGDVRKFTGKRILEVVGKKPGELDCVCGGPPCQGFSISGKRDVMDPRNSLVFEFARLVLEIQPKAFCMENVVGLLSMVTPEGVPVIDALCHVFEDGGFGPWEALRKSLLASSGAGAAMKSHLTKGWKKDAKTEEDEDEQKQPALFQEETAI